MKFTILFIPVFYLASFVTSDRHTPHYFTLPLPGSTFYYDQEIMFVTDGVTNEYEDSITAVLYHADSHTKVKELGCYRGGQLVRNEREDNWVMDWTVDVEPGRYYVRLFEREDNDYYYQHEDDIEDVFRSYDFTVGSHPRKRAWSRRKRDPNLKDSSF